MPAGGYERWAAERSDWFRRHGIEPTHPTWRDELSRHQDRARIEFDRQIARRWDTPLDECCGSCPLRTPALAAIVGGSLRHFDGGRYRLTDFVVMPNHVHVRAAFADGAGMLTQCESWNRFTAVRLNRELRRTGRFWQVDGLDRLVRDAEHFERFRRHIGDNPHHAGLVEGESLRYPAPDLPAAIPRQGRSLSPRVGSGVALGGSNLP